MSSRSIHFVLVALLAVGFVDNTFSACCCRVPAAVDEPQSCCSAPEPDEGCCHGEGECQGLLGKPCREKGPQQSGPDTPDILPTVDVDVGLSSVAVTEWSSVAVTELGTDFHDPPLFILNATFLI